MDMKVCDPHVHRFEMETMWTLIGNGPADAGLLCKLSALTKLCWPLALQASAMLLWSFLCANPSQRKAKFGRLHVLYAANAFILRLCLD